VLSILIDKVAEYTNCSRNSFILQQAVEKSEEVIQERERESQSFFLIMKLNVFVNYYQIYQRQTRHLKKLMQNKIMLKFTSLHSEFNTSTFSCSNSLKLEEYLKKYASQDIKKQLCSCFIAIDDNKI
jgi:uncharacterized protein (DUF1778 family)